MVDNIPFTLRLKIDNLLDPNETIEWSQTPLLKIVLKREYPKAIVGVILLGLFIFFLAVVIKQADILLKTLSSFVIIPGILISIVMILTPFYIILVNHRNIYIITNKRALSLSKTIFGYAITSRYFDEMNHIDKEINENGMGSIWFYKTFTMHKHNRKEFSYEGFIGIDNAKAIHKLLITKIKDAKNTNEVSLNTAIGISTKTMDYLPEKLRLTIQNLLEETENIEALFQPVKGKVILRKLPRILGGILMFVLLYFGITKFLGVSFYSLLFMSFMPALVILTVLYLIIPPLFAIYGYTKGIYVVTDRRIVRIRKTFTGYKEQLYKFDDMVNLYIINEDKQGNGDLSFRLLLRNRSNKNRDNFIDNILIGIPNIQKIKKRISSLKRSNL